MGDYKDLPFAEWLEDTAQAVIEIAPDSICLVGIKNEDGSVLTTYYNADLSDMGRFVANITSDIVIETIRANSGVIKSFLDDTKGDRPDERI